MNENKHLKVVALSELENLKVHGRTTRSLSPLTLFWTGSALELNATGSELWVEIEANYDNYEPWVSFLVNANLISRQMVTQGRHWVCLFRGMSETTVKNIRIVRDSQAMSQDPGCSLQIHAVKSDGEFLTVQERPYKIEFIGDSITSGEGTIGARSEEDWIPMWFSAIYNYSAMIAEALNAEYRVISQSGWGVLTSFDNNPHGNIPEYYDKVCGLLTGEKNEALGAFEDNDFDAWQPDIIIVNLGTNDAGAFQSPEWKDEISGETHKQRLNEDGTYHEEDLKSFEKAAQNFLIKLRQHNQNAHILWAYGMLGIPMMKAIYRAVDKYTKATGDQKISVFQLPNTKDETMGARNHPGKLAHEETSKELTNYIKQILVGC